jgi:hypothetical protein
MEPFMWCVALGIVRDEMKELEKVPERGIYMNFLFLSALRAGNAAAFHRGRGDVSVVMEISTVALYIYLKFNKPLFTRCWSMPWKSL